MSTAKPYLWKIVRRTLYLHGPFEDEYAAVVAMALQDKFTLDGHMQTGGRDRNTRYGWMAHKVQWFEDGEVMALHDDPAEYTDGVATRFSLKPKVKIDPRWLEGPYAFQTQQQTVRWIEEALAATRHGAPG